MNEAIQTQQLTTERKKDKKKKRRRQKDKANKVINKYTVLALANSWRITLFKGPDALGNFCYFAKKFVIISVIQVRPVNFFPPNFVKHYQTSHAPLSCFGAGQIFVRCGNRTDLTICTA